MERVHRILSLGILLGLGLLTGCASTTTSGTVGISRQQLLLIPAATVERQSAQMYSAMTTEASKKSELNVNVEMTKRVRGIAERMIPHVGEFRKDAANWNWEVNVFESEQINAFCMPGGKIGFYSGIIEKLELNDDEIAAIMGHEIAHALREHGREKISQQTLGRAIVAGLAASQKPQNQVGTYQIATLASQLFVHLPFSRHMESEADAMGLELSARAGYDPAAAAVLWEKMGRASKGSPPEFLSTHPSGVTRIAEIKALLPKVQSLHEQALASKGAPIVATVAAVAPAGGSPTLSAPTAPTRSTMSSLAPSGAATAGKRAKVSGTESFQLRGRILRETPSCTPDPAVHMVDEKTGTETYEAECVDGTVLRYSCTFGVCKSLLASAGASRR